ncbi:ABC transporter permease [Enterococcus hulanensis]|uniref:ABC transporter permease n=1 Tax=Enterococcus hulanensis TaxID=2559929 RepID=UPI00289135D2|nr:ABC transporter permease [Enterococcus hulanensis]MDT2661127.1 ABC transporter permease [Enterococcus hulanensis]
MSVIGLKTNITDTRQMGSDPTYYKRNFEDYKKNIYDISISMNYDDDILFEKREATITDLFFSDIQSRIILVFITIFVSFFIGSEWTSGFIKNISNELFDRGKLVFSKFISVAIFLAGLIISYYVFSGILFSFIFGYIHIGLTQHTIWQFLCQYILHLAFASLIILLAYLVKNPAICVPFGVVAAVNIFSLFYSKIDLGIRHFYHGFKTIMDYTVTGNIAFIGIDANASKLVLASSVSLFFICFSLFFSYRSLKKSEI